LTEEHDHGIPRYSLWLLPDESWSARLRREIEKLATIFVTPVFEAHVTVHGDLPLEREELAGSLPGLAAGLSPFSWRVQSVETSPWRFRSLYLRLVPLPEFDRLKARSRECFGRSEGLPPFPHLSLAYGEPAEGSPKRPLAARLSAEYSGLDIGFSRLALARSSSSLPMEEWKILEQISL